MIEAQIEALARQGFTGAEIHRRLGEVLAEDKIPSSSTVRDVVRRMAADRSGVWTLLESTEPPAVNRAILWVLGVVIIGTRGRVKTFTKDEARRVGTLMMAFPTLSPFSVWTLATQYAKREQLGISTADLDVYLAIKPWRGPNTERLYAEALSAGTIPGPPPFNLPGAPEVTESDLSQADRELWRQMALAIHETFDIEYEAGHAEGLPRPPAND